MTAPEVSALAAPEDLPVSFDRTGRDDARGGLRLLPGSRLSEVARQDVWLAALSGGDFPALGEVGVSHFSDRLAIAVSRGRHRKGYAHVDPNEDAVLAASGPGGHVLAVLDGHNGLDAAEAALRTVADAAPRLVGRAHVGRHGLLEVYQHALAAVCAAVDGLQGPRRGSRTAMSLVLVRGGRLLHATAGDTVVVLARGRKASLISAPGDWLGPRSAVPRVLSARLRRDDRLIVASDGLSDFLGRDWVQEVGARAMSLPAANACVDLITTAGARGAGDNVAVGVLRAG